MEMVGFEDPRNFHCWCCDYGWRTDWWPPQPRTCLHVVPRTDSLVVTCPTCMGTDARMLHAGGSSDTDLSRLLIEAETDQIEADSDLLPRS